MHFIVYVRARIDTIHPDAQGPSQAPWPEDAWENVVQGLHRRPSPSSLHIRVIRAASFLFPTANPRGSVSVAMLSVPLPRPLARVPALLLLLAFATQAVAQSSRVEQLYEEAKAAEAHGNLPAAIARYEQIISADPSLAEAYNNLGSLYFDTHQYDKAATTLKRALALRPHMASASAVLGSTYLAMGDLGNACKQFENAVRENPRDLRSEDLLEQSLIQEKDYSAAARRLESRIAHDPKNHDALYRLGKVYLEISQSTLLKARDLDPNSALAHELQGEAFEALGNLEQARTEYQAAVQISPDKPGTHEHLGNILWIQGLWPQSRAEFEAELKNDPNNCSARWKAGNTYLNERENIPQALVLLEEAITRCPDLMQARVDRAKALILAGDSSRAIEDLVLAERANPEEPSIHFWLAKAYRAQGQDNAATLELEQFNRLNTRPTEKAGTEPASAITH